MGVHGLWRLIEPSGKPVPLETLENKILAVDISIWLHQAIKGFQDSKGAPLPNAHLLGIYHRVCKLLYFRIKPVFIFDGGVPVLKKQTIAKRNQQKHKNINEATDIQSKLLKTLLKHSAISKVIADKAITTNDLPDKEKTKENMFILPAVPSTVTDDSTLDSGSSSDESSATSPVKQWDLHTIDEKSSHFRSLPADVRHEILTDLIETRKQSSWGRIHEIPTESNDFSSFQMKRLLKRFSVQTSLEECVKEMGGHSLSLGDLEKLLNAEGIITDTQKTGGKRIAYDDETRFLLIKDVQKAMEDAKKKLQAIEENPESTSSSNENQSNEIITTTTDVELERDLEAAIHLSLQTNDENTKEEIQESAVIEENRSVDDEYEKDLQAAIQLSLQDQPSTSKDLNKENLSLIDSFNEEEMDSDSDNDNVTTITKLQQAKSYMLEYSGLTPNEIDKIINSNKQKPKVINKSKKLLINKKPEKIPELSSTTIDEEKPKSPETKAPIEIKSDNESNSLPEISKKENTVEIMSDSDDSDFVEVSSSNSNKLDINKESLQIVINPKEKVDDDIFSDIFNENKPVITKLDQEVIKPTLEVLDITKEKEEIEKIEIIKESELKTIEDKIETIEDDKETIEYNKKEVEDNKEEIEDNEEIVKNKQIQKIIPEKPLLTIEELNKMKSDLVSEQEELILERNARTRIAGNITDQMYQEAQELLELFGVPYVIAPMEAEAQCAFLNEINLTDGTITDDSDIWLFGGKTVYKNFFNQNKHVLEFRAESIEHHFKLTRQQLILLAMLVGSDYTVGIQGIGPVTALEILAAFPPSRQTNISVLTQAELISGLKEFRKWLCDSKTIGVGRTTLRSKLKNVNINEGFPNMQVVQAYLQPEVETCADRFTWSKPDIVGLIDFAKEKFGWTKLKSEEILKPVIKKMEDKNIQKTIRNYFATKHKINVDLTEDKLSKRVKKAINKIANKDQDEDVDEDKPKKTKGGKTNKRTKQEGETSKPKTTKKSKTEVSKPDDEPEKEDLEPKPSITRKTKIDYQNLGTINKENPHPASIEAKRRVRARKKEQLHIKESIPQKEQDKRAALKSKLKAIEVFRKSKEGPGFVKKRPKVITPVKEDAGLSESSSDD